MFQAPARARLIYRDTRTRGYLLGLSPIKLVAYWAGHLSSLSPIGLVTYWAQIFILIETHRELV